MKFSTLATKIKSRLKKALVVTATALTAVAGANFTALPANAALAYDFTEWTFTPCGQTGRLGPTLEMCKTAYSASSFASDSNYFFVDSQGQQWFKPPVTAFYRFEIAGAAGGGTNGGKGLVVQEQVSLDSTKWYCMAIGQKGVADTKSADSGGGGGGTWFAGNSPQLVNTGGNCSNSATPHVGGGGGGGNTPGLDANADLSVGGTTISSIAGTGRGAGAATTAIDGGRGGPLTGSSARNLPSVATGALQTNTGAYVGGAQVVSSMGSNGMNSAIGGGTFGLGLGGDGGFPNGGASCDCVPSGGGGGGGGGYTPGGGGGYNADGTGGGGGGGGSRLAQDMHGSNPSFNLRSINTGDGYVKLSYLASAPAVSSLTTLSTTGVTMVGNPITASQISFASVDSGSTTSWKWQTVPNITYLGGSPLVADIPNSNTQSFTPTLAQAGLRIRSVQIVTTSSGSVFYFPGPISQIIVGPHSITGTPPDSFRGDPNYSFSFGLDGAFSGTASGWSKVSGTLPPGMTLSTSGILSTSTSLTTEGTYTFEVGHSNTYETATKTVTITVGPGLAFTTTASASCVWENFCSKQVTATSPQNETLTYSLWAGTFPPGLSLDPATGLVSGTYLSNLPSVIVYIKATVPSGAYGIQKVTFSNTTKTTQGFFSGVTAPSSNWNLTTPPTTSLSWMQPTPNTGLTRLIISTPEICSGPSGYITSPVTLTALKSGTCNFALRADGDATYNSQTTGTRAWSINGIAQANTTAVALASGSLNWVSPGPSITVQGSGGSGTGAFRYTTTSAASVCVVDPVTGVVTWLTFGSCTVNGQRLGDSDYAASNLGAAIFTPIAIPQSTAATVIGVPSSIAYSANGTFVIDGSGGDFGPGLLPAYTFNSLTTSVCTVSSVLKRVTIVNAGTCQVQVRANATGAFAAGASFGPVTTIDITGTAQAPITMVVNAGSPVNYPGGNVSIALSGGSGTGAWSWSADPSTSSVCSGSGTASGGYNAVTSNPGTCLINVTHAAQGGFTALTQQLSFTVNKGTQATVSGTFSPTSITFNPTTPATATITGSGGTGTGTYTYTLSAASAAICSLTGTTVTALGAGSCVVNVLRLGNSFYNDSAVSARTLTISKASQTTTVTVTANRSTLSSSDTEPLVVTAAGGNGTGSYVYSTSTSTICSVDASTGVVTPIALGTCTVKATRAADTNYLVSASSPTGVNITVSKLTQATFTASSTVTTSTYGSGTFTVSSTGGSGTGSTTYASGNTAICTVVATTGVTTIVATGSCVITATKASDTNYLAASSSVTITIAKANQATYTASSTKTSVTIGATTGITVSATGGGGTGTATSSTFASGDTSVCTVNSTTGVVTVLTAGSCVITATRTGGTNYSDATSSVTITIAKTAQATVTATANRTTGTYGDGLSYNVTGSGGSGTGAFSYSSNSESVCSVGSVSGAVTILTAGTCSITATRASDASYAAGSGTATITIAKGSQSAITASVDNAAPDYTESPKATAQVSYTGGSGTGAATYSTSTAGVCSVDSSGLVTDITRGKCIVTVTIAADTNYNAASASVTIRFGKVDQAAVSVTSTKTSVVYGAGSSITVSLTGGSGSGAVSFATSSANCSVDASTGVVTYTVVGDCVVTGTKAGDIDYAEISDSVTITVTKANQGSIVATASSTTTTYNSGDSITASYTGGSGTGAISYSTTSSACSVNSSTGAVTLLLAGNCIVTVTKATDANYTEASSNVTITIAKANQGMVVASPSRTTGVYADGVSTSVSPSGGSGSGSYSYSSTSASVCSVNASTGAVTILTAGTCSITVTKAADANYNVATGSTSIVISKANQAAVTATKSANTTYGSATQITVTSSGGSGTGTFSYASTTTGICTINSSSGVIAIVTAGDCVLTATRAADTNYNSASGSVTITIAKASQAAVSASATRTTSTYADGSSNTVALSGGSGNGSISFASSTTSVCSIVSATGVLTVLTAGTCSITATKAADTNYNVATASITITISKATQATFTASSSPSNTTFGSSTTVTISGTGGSGTGAVSYASTTASVCSVDASTGVITIVTAGTCSITATKAADTNYNVVTASTSVVIAKATQSTLTLTPDNSSVVFGDGQSANVTVSGGSGTGAVSYASNSTGICSVNASTGAVTILTAGTCSITVTKATSTNYNVATATASITVAKGAQATVNITGNQSLTHSTSNPTSQLSVTGGSGNGTVSYAVDSSSNGICVVSAGGLVTGLHAGTCVINVTKAGDANYNAGTASYTITIAKATQANLSVTGSANLTYSATNAVTTQLNVSGGSSSGAVTFSVDSGSSTVCSVSSNGLVTVLTAGTCVIAITKAGDSDYLVRTTSFTVNIAKATQATLIVRTAAELAYNPNTPATTTVSLTAGGSGTGSVSFSTTSTACSVVGNVVTALSAGACAITATKAADTNFNVATASYTVIVTKALQTALVATPSRTTLKFGDQSNNSATVTLAGGSGTGAINWFVDPTTTGVCSVDFSATPAVVTAITGGTCKVNITKAGDSDFEPATTVVTFTIQKNTQASLTVSSTKTAAMKDETATLSATGGSSSGNISYSVVTGAAVCSISGSTITFIGAGTCSVKATRAGDANYDAIDSATIELSATKAEQTQLVVAQSAGMLPNVAIGGKADTSWTISGGNGNGTLSVSAITGCYATITGSTLNVTAGNVAGNCSIDVEKGESNDYNSTSYRISLQVFNLASAAVIGTPVLNMNSSPDGVGVDVPFTPSSTGTFVAPVTGYQLQSKSGSNWVNADNGFATGPTADKVSISVTPWTSIFVRVAAVSEYESTNGASRIWSTYGGATAQAFSVPGIITSLSLTTISAKSPETITVTGAGYSQSATPTVEFTAASPIFQINGVNTATITLPATVKSATQLTFKYPGALLPSGAKTLAASVKVNGATAMKSNGAQMTLTQEEESLDLGLDLNGGKFAPKVGTVYSGSFTWAFNTAKGAKIFLVPTCTTYKTVKGVKTCTKTVLKDSSSCTISQAFPLNKAAVRRMVTFKVPCQLNVTGKLAVLAATPIDIVAKATFNRTYPKTNLAYVLVKGKKTKPLAPTKATYIYLLGNKQLVKK
jgi:hypothetical protein